MRNTIGTGEALLLACGAGIFGVAAKDVAVFGFDGLNLMLLFISFTFVYYGGKGL